MFADCCNVKYFLLHFYSYRPDCQIDLDIPEKSVMMVDAHNTAKLPSSAIHLRESVLLGGDGKSNSQRNAQLPTPGSDLLSISLLEEL